MDVAERRAIRAASGTTTSWKTNPGAAPFSPNFRAYSNHPLHDAFVHERWISEVEDFQESDFEAM